MKNKTTSILHNIRLAALILVAILMFIYLFIVEYNIINIILCSCILALMILIVIIDCILKKYKIAYLHIVWLGMWIAILVQNIPV